MEITSPAGQYMHIGAGMAEVISTVKFTRVEFTVEITSAAGRGSQRKSLPQHGAGTQKTQGGYRCGRWGRDRKQC